MAVNAELSTPIKLSYQSIHRKSVLVISVCRKDHGWVLTVCTQRILFNVQLKNFSIIILQLTTAYLWEWDFI